SSVAPIQSMKNSILSKNRPATSSSAMETKRNPHKILEYLTNGSIMDASSEKFLCDSQIRYWINLTGDDNQILQSDRCSCDRPESAYHFGRQKKLTIKICPKSKPEIIFGQFDEINKFIGGARKIRDAIILVFNESGENEVECVALQFIMFYFQMNREKAEEYMEKLQRFHNETNRLPRKGIKYESTMSDEMRTILDSWNDELRKREVRKLANDVNQMDFGRVDRKCDLKPKKIAWA
ncbi:hypothetical protein PFISCL1PPCAC_5853, partial [Pristionchus fissidentatus]